MHSLVLAVVLSLGVNPKPKVLGKLDLKPVPKVTTTCVVKDGVPKCVILGTFPDNPAWEKTLRQLKLKMKPRR